MLKYKLISTKSLNETTLKKLLNTHSNAGYIIISACREEFNKDQNKKTTEILHQKLKQSGFGFIPVWGGFIETSKDGKQTAVKERSFIVFNYKGNEKQNNTTELFKLGHKLIQQDVTSEYGQDSFLYKPENVDDAVYINKHGAVDKRFKTTSPTQAADVYFTNLRKHAKTLDKSFTFHESYVPLSPRCLSEAYSRGGELFFDFLDEKRGKTI